MKLALFAFEEPEHLTRIGLKLGLEDIGFVVDEHDHGLVIAGASAFDAASLPKPRAITSISEREGCAGRDVADELRASR